MVEAGVGGHARAEAPEDGPQARLTRGPGALEDPAAEHALAQGRDALERGGEIEEIGLGLELPALGLLEPRRGRGEQRIDHVADRRLRGLVEAPGEPPPGDPELLPDP